MLKGRMLKNPDPDALVLYVVAIQATARSAPTQVLVWAINRQNCVAICRGYYKSKPLGVTPFLDFCVP